MTPWIRKRKSRDGSDRLPEVKEIFGHYQATCRKTIKTGGWVDFKVDGPALRRILERVPTDERTPETWLLKQFITNHFMNVREKSKTRLSYIIWKYQEEQKVMMPPWPGAS